ncbi:MAG TPA: hypothetical protein VFE46_06050 [Pirellulales bacterium]|nr:hypothetical protein [Pirellulales bacterium]
MIKMLRQPLISIQIDKRQQEFEPGEVLAGAFQIDAVDPAALRAVEISVLWFTEGAGDEDLGVHYFERVSAEDVPELNLHQRRRFQTVLPNSPLSYEGFSVKICWCVRVRIFLREGRDFVAEKAFHLGAVPPPVGSGEQASSQ